jgi:hypothetical protein
VSKTALVTREQLPDPEGCGLDSFKQEGREIPSLQVSSHLRSRTTLLCYPAGVSRTDCLPHTCPWSLMYD